MKQLPRRCWNTAVPLLIGLSLIASGGCREPTLQIVVIANGVSAFEDAVRLGAEDAHRDLALGPVGLETVVERADTPEGQIALLDRLSTQANVVGVAVSVIDPDNELLIQALRKLNAQGIPVVTYQSDVNRAKARKLRVAFFGSDDRGAGAVLGAVAQSLLPAGGGFVTFAADTTARDAMGRIGGFAASVGPKFEELHSMPDNGDSARMRENVRQAILDYGDKLKVLVGISRPNGPAIADVVRQDYARDRYVILAFGAEPDALQGMGEGGIDALVVENPYRMGFDAVRLLAALAVSDEVTQKEMLPKLGQPDGDLGDTELNLIVPDVGSKLTKEPFPENVTLFRLSEFRQWLSERNLSGS